MNGMHEKVFFFLNCAVTLGLKLGAKNHLALRARGEKHGKKHFNAERVYGGVS